MAVILAVAAGISRGWAQPVQEEEPYWMKWRLTDAYLKLDMEGERETVSSAKTGSQTSNQRIYLAPAIGLGAIGSIYHPDFLALTLKAEPGYVWQQIGPPGGPSSHETSWLQNYNASGTFLQTKPYSTTLFGSGTHDIHQYDFFNSAVVDVQSWGGSSGYRTGPVPMTVSFLQSHEDLRGLFSGSVLDQTTLNYHARNERAHENATDLTYLYSHYDQSTDGFGDQSDSHYVTLTDAEHLKKSTLNSTLWFNQLDSQSDSSTSVNAMLDLGVEHTKNLRSFYDYSFNHFTDAGSEANQHFLRVGLQHQLYESLTTGLDVHGNELQSDSSGSSLDAQSVGTQGTVNYVKRLGSWGHLSIGNVASYDWTQQSSSGSAVVVPGESHSTTLLSPQFFLTQPRPVSITSITASGVPLNEETNLNTGGDYIVNRTLTPWQITLDYSSSKIQTLEAQNAGTVTALVTYLVQANPSGNYSTFSDEFQARLDLFRQLLGVYFRLTKNDSAASSPGFVFENVMEYQAGADFNWRGFKLDANYTDRHSTLYDFSASTLSEGYSVKVSTDSTFGLNLRQEWADYPSQHQRATFYDFMGSYEWRPALLHFGWTAEGGLQRQRGAGLDQDLYTARTYFNWNLGKLSLHLGYEFQDQNFSGELRKRNFAFLRAMRKF